MLAFLKDNIPGSCLSAKIRYGRLVDRSTSPRREYADGRDSHCRGGQPTKGRSANWPMTCFREAISMIMTVIGTAATPFMTALQSKALMGSSGVTGA